MEPAFEFEIAIYQANDLADRAKILYGMIERSQLEYSHRAPDAHKYRINCGIGDDVRRLCVTEGRDIFQPCGDLLPIVGCGFFLFL